MAAKGLVTKKGTFGGHRCTAAIDNWKKGLYNKNWKLLHGT
jgi:hypothetical protein